MREKIFVLLAAFFLVFTPIALAQEEDATTSMANQTEALAGAISNLDLGALLGGSVGGLLSALGSSLGGIFSIFGSTTVAMLLSCMGIPMVGSITAYFLAKLYGMTAGVNVIGAVCLGGAGLMGLLTECCAPILGTIGLCCFIPIQDPISSICAFCGGFCPEIIGTIDELCSTCLTCTYVPAFVGGILTAVAGFASVASAALAVLSDACLNLVSLGIALIPGLCCTGFIEGCVCPPWGFIGLWPLQCMIGACVGLINPIALDLAGDIAGVLGVCTSYLLGIPALCFSCITGVCGLCGIGVGGASTIFGVCEALCSIPINPCTSCLAVCIGLCLQLWGILDEVFAWIEGIVSGLCCCYDLIPCTCLGPLATQCLGGVEGCIAACKLPCLLL